MLGLNWFKNRCYSHIYEKTESRSLERSEGHVSLFGTYILKRGYAVTYKCVKCGKTRIDEEWKV
jgi:hypothetical protein